MPSTPRAPRLGVALLWTLLALALPGALAAQEAGPPGADRIEVAGRGIVHGEPDVAHVQLGVERTAPEVGAALSDANQALAAVREALLQHGVAEEDVRTETFDVRQDRQRDGEGRVQDTTYRVVHMLAVRSTDLDGLGELLSAAVNTGADRIGAIRFELEDPGALEERARTLAMEDARGKARQLADAAERTLGPVRVVREGGGGGLTGDDAPAAELLSARAVASDVPVATGTLAVEVRLEVIFALE